MHSNPVVVELDVLEDILFRLLSCFIAPFLDKLPFERLEERFRHYCVVQRCSRPEYRLRHTMGVQVTLEGLGCVLGALVVMKDKASIIRGISRPAACLIASMATFSVIRSDIDQPTTLREKASITAAR